MERMARKKDKALQQVFEAQKRVRGDDSNQQKRGWSRGVAADVIDLELNRAVLDQDQAEAAPSPDQPIVNSGAMMAAVIEWLKTPDQDKIATAVANNADKVVALELAKMGINSTAELYKVMGVNQPSVPDSKTIRLMQEYARLRMAPAGYSVSRADLAPEPLVKTPRYELACWRESDGFKTMPGILRDLLEKAVREWTTPSQQEFDSVERMVEIECV